MTWAAGAARAQEAAPPPVAVPGPAPIVEEAPPEGYQGPILGAEAEGHSASTPLEIHGFVSQGLIKSTANNYLAKSERGSLEVAEAGINLTKALADRLTLGVQLFARDLGPIGDYSAKFDWFYLDYRVTDWLGLRAGRVKLPFGLYNEFADVDSARAPILLPQSIYSTRSRDYLLSHTGFEVHGYHYLGGLGALDYRLFFGTVFIDVASTTPSTASNLESPYVTGGRLLWETPLAGLRVGGSLQALRLDFDFTAPAAPGMPLMPGHYKLPVRMWVASLEYAFQDLLLAAEYGRWRVTIDTNVMLPEAISRVTTSERYYALASYRLTSWLSPSIYYSGLWANVADREGRDAYQHDLAATLRFDLTSNLIAKLEGHFLYGTADLQPNLNGGQRREQLTESWGLFLLKLTAFF